METHTIRRARGIRARVIAVLFAVMIAVGVLAVQVTSVWSTNTQSPGKPAGTSIHYRNGSSSERIRVGPVDAIPRVGRPAPQR